MELSQRRRGLVGFGQESELYPVGTNIIQKYGISLKTRYTINTTTGEYVADSSYCASSVYIPISPDYTYWKRGVFPNRVFLSVFAFYDKDKNYIGYYSKKDYNDFVIPNIPANARYARVSIPNGSYRDLRIIREA